MTYALDLQNVTKQYSDFTLDSISLKIPSGKIVGLIGENGAGKTTLISLILNQIKRDYGTIKILSKDNIKSEIDVKTDIGFVVDECGFHPSLTPKDINVIMKGIYTKWDHEFYRVLLAEFKVPLKKQICNMSKGMKSKLMIAVSIAHSPKLLIFDEVTSGLDPVVRDDILYFIQNYVRENNATVFFSTHITSDLEKVADEIAFIDRGKLVFYEPVSSILEKYHIVKLPLSEKVPYQEDGIITSLTRDDMRLLLIDTRVYKAINPSHYHTTLDDIMLLHIKGH